MKSNFAFLKPNFPSLAKNGELAERYLYSDPNSCMVKLGIIAEKFTHVMLELEKIPEPEYDNTQYNRIQLLKRERVLPREFENILNTIRKDRNDAAHNYSESTARCKSLLKLAYKLGVFLIQVYVDWNYEPEPFVMPTDESNQPDYQALLKEKDRELNELREQLSAPVLTGSRGERVNRAAQLVNRLSLDEGETRLLIDAQLRAVGWEADTLELRYSKGVRPQKNRNLAIAEWPTDSKVKKSGAVDYALFVGLELVGLIEAKAIDMDVASVLDYQGEDYSKHIRSEDMTAYGKWSCGEYAVPFFFASNSRPYVEELKSKSGIWCRDYRDGTSKALRGWMSPENMLAVLKQDKEKAEKELKSFSYDYLENPDGLSLRYYQVNAVKAVDQGLYKGKREMLVAMATGTGKTRTALAMIYRFLYTGRFRRILFLVDRTSLGDQTIRDFKKYRVEGLKTIDQIYQVNDLEHPEIEESTKIHIATVQGMMSRVLRPKDGVKMPGINDYDLIIVDEAHRGYTLDQEMSEEELIYRDQADFQSKYKAVIEYFDAVKIALTATPAPHTISIFGPPVFRYSYREAVLDDFLIDHNAPHNLETALSKNGIRFKKGENLRVYNPETFQMESQEVLEDELSFDVETFNRSIVNSSFNRIVLEEVMKNLDPEDRSAGKTLIFAVKDSHADEIVDIIRDICRRKGITEKCVQKITRKAAGGDPDRVKEAIGAFKNEQYPSIAVTVDLLTTGIDVPVITTLVFMRKVRSRVLYEQMIGRATRLCPEINKDHFEIYDPVRLYEDLEPVTSMKPVVANVNTSFSQILDGLAVVTEEEQIKGQIEQVIAKLNRKKRRMRPETLTTFSDLTGGKTPEQFLAEISALPPMEAKEVLLSHADLFDMVDKATPISGKIVISDAEDKLLSHTRGYGKGKTPEDYLESFTDYIKTHMEENVILKMVCTRPKDLTRNDLKHLRATLDREGFTRLKLNTALNESRNTDMAADIITLIRSAAIGSPLISQEERVHRAIARLKAAHNFSKTEIRWLNTIEKYLRDELPVINVATFDEDDRFRGDGGFRRINKQFNNQLESVIIELNEYLYDDGGVLA